MNDAQFGPLEVVPVYDDGTCHLDGKAALDFGGKPCTVKLALTYCPNGDISPFRRESWQQFQDIWPQLQPELLQSLIRYYNEEERFSWGPDDPEEFAAWWPEIQTAAEILQAVKLTDIVIPDDFVGEIRGGKCLFLLFDRTWGGPDWDKNGVGVCICEGEIAEIANRDIAY